MRGIAIATLVCAVALSGARARAGYQTAPAAYTLATIMADPQAFLDRDVLFLCRFAAPAELFHNSAGRVNPGRHANFAAWPDKAILWEKQDRRNVLPTLYIDKSNRAAADALARLGRYDLVAVTGRVVDVQAGFPCIVVEKLEPSANPAEKLSPHVIDQMRKGCEALRIEAGDVAARHFEQALVLGLPGVYRAKAYEQLAQANLLANRLDLARNCLRQAVQASPNDAVLYAALADVALRLHAPDEALAHAAYALERTPGLTQAHGIKAEALAASGDATAAAEALAAAHAIANLSGRDLAMLDVRRARVQTRAGNHAEAASAYAAAAEPGTALSNDGWLHKEIGLFYEKLALETGNAGHLDSAHAAYEHACRLDKDDPDTLYSLMEVEFRRQKASGAPDYTAVAAMAQAAARAHPGYAPARILEGRALFAQGRTGEAEHRYQAVSNRVAHDPAALLCLAEAFVELGRRDEAAATVRRARDLQPWNDRLLAIGPALEQGVGMAVALHEEGVVVATQPPDIQTSAEPGATAVPYGKRLPVTKVTLPPDAWPAPVMREAEVDADGYLRFGMIAGVDAAYALLPLPATEVLDAPAEADEARRPQAFSFAPDDSPVLLASVRSPGRGERDMPVRNANLYRRWPGPRRPAEIIEREPVSPHVGLDTPAMVPPKNGGTPRTDVRIPRVLLPSSSRGIGASGERR